MRKLFAILPLAGLMFVADATAADKASKEHRKAEKKEHKAEWKADKAHDNVDRRFDRQDDWMRATEGHQPHDLNGDGMIQRQEWPGNETSFRQLDRNRDGVLSDRDRNAQLNSRAVVNFHPADRNKDGVVSRTERNQANRR